MKLAKLLYFSFLLFLFPAINLSAQENLPLSVDLDYIAKAGIPKFSVSEDFFNIVPAAGMEILADEEETESDIVDDLIDFAYSFMGTHYRRGGKTPKGFDCSGFTGYVFSQFGYNLNSSSASQFLQGEKIESREEIIPGDLVFFSGSAGGQRIGHVGIAIEVDYESGNVSFIHSAIGGGIKIDSTSEPYYAKRYKGARRIIE